MWVFLRDAVAHVSCKAAEYHVARNEAMVKALKDSFALAKAVVRPMMQTHAPPELHMHMIQYFNTCSLQGPRNMDTISWYTSFSGPGVDWPIGARG